MSNLCSQNKIFNAYTIHLIQAVSIINTLRNWIENISICREVLEDTMNFRLLQNIGYFETDIEATDQVHTVQDMLHTGCTNDH